VPVDALIQPHDSRPPFIAVGTNYAEHAAEVSVDDQSLPFPRLADMVRPDQDVEFGLLLCNDSGHGQPTFLPTGYLLVIPAEARLLRDAPPV
jgi:hypothetical protein